MFRQRAVSEAVAPHGSYFVYDVNDAAGIQQPKADKSGHYRHDLAHLDRCLRGPCLHPAKAEMHPALQSSPGRCQNFFPLAQLDPGPVYRVTGWRHSSRRPNRPIGEIQVGLSCKKAPDLRSHRLVQ
jgi:hypothetical protein